MFHHHNQQRQPLMTKKYKTDLPKLLRKTWRSIKKKKMEMKEWNNLSSSHSRWTLNTLQQWCEHSPCLTSSWTIIATKTSSILRLVLIATLKKITMKMAMFKTVALNFKSIFTSLVIKTLKIVNLIGPVKVRRSLKLQTLQTFYTNLILIWTSMLIN